MHIVSPRAFKRREADAAAGWLVLPGAESSNVCHRSQYARASENIPRLCSLDMERAMRATGWSESGVRRVVVIGGATTAVMIALLFAKPFYSATTAEAPSSADVSQPVADQEPATETVSIVASPTIDTNSQFFFGCGDGSNGYYAERPEPTLALVRYERMP